MHTHVAVTEVHAADLHPPPYIYIIYNSPLTCWGESRVNCALVICPLVLSIRVLLDNILCINITSLVIPWNMHN